MSYVEGDILINKITNERFIIINNFNIGFIVLENINIPYLFPQLYLPEEVNKLFNKEENHNKGRVFKII